ncbi:MAG: hypothetical protein ACLFVJ_16070 [Persicimonas sp.]
MNRRVLTRLIFIGVLVLGLGASCDDDTTGERDGSAEDAAGDADDEPDARRPDRDADADDADSSDVPPDTGGQGPNPVWSTFENRCAPERDVVDPEPVMQGESPMEPGDQPQMLWRKAEICPGFPEDEEASGDGFDHATSQDFAYGRFEIDGDDVDVVVVVKDGYEPDLLGAVPQAIAILDAETGESLECMQLPLEANITERSLKVVSGQGIYVPYVTQRGEAAEEFDIPDIFGLAAYRPGEGKLFDEQIDIARHSRGGNGADSQITANGQVVVNWKHRRLVSFDFETGEVYWTIGADAFDVEHDDFSLRGPFALSGDRLVVKVDGRFYQVDRCGEAKEIENLPRTRILSIVNDSIVARTADSVIVNPNDDSRIEFDVSCESMVTMSGSRVACTSDGTSSRGDPVLLVNLLDFESGDVNEATIVPPSDATYVGFTHDSVAVTDNHVMVGAKYSLESEGSIRRFHVFDTSAMTERETFDIHRPSDATASSSAIRPVVTPQGKVIVATWGWVFAVQTGFSGLADSPHPRGILGGNENRGYVQPADE